jgi:hypothetical protein
MIIALAKCSGAKPLFVTDHPLMHQSESIRANCCCF